MKFPAIFVILASLLAISLVLALPTSGEFRGPGIRGPVSGPVRGPAHGAGFRGLVSHPNATKDDTIFDHLKHGVPKDPIATPVASPVATPVATPIAAPIVHADTDVATKAYDPDKEPTIVYHPKYFSHAPIPLPPGKSRPHVFHGVHRESFDLRSQYKLKDWEESEPHCKSIRQVFGGFESGMCDEWFDDGYEPYICVAKKGCDLNDLSY